MEISFIISVDNLLVDIRGSLQDGTGEGTVKIVTEEHGETQYYATLISEEGEEITLRLKKTK